MSDNSSEHGVGATDDWVRKIVVEKSSSLSEFMDSKRSMITSSMPDDVENALLEIQAVILKLPADFLSYSEVVLLLEFYVNSLDFASLPSISTIHHLITKLKKLPEHYEEVLIRTVYKERNLQSWPQKERLMLYEILHWLLKNRTAILKSMGEDFLATFLKSVSGERDPRCLVHMFSAFLEVAAQFPLGPFSEEMFEIVVCYFPVDFKPQAGDTVTRDYLAATCASCLTASRSFAPWCLLFIDEKLNDDECGEQEYIDILDLFMLASESFDKKEIVKQVEPLLHGFRKLALDPQRKGVLPTKVISALRALFTISAQFENVAKKVVKSILEDSEPFVIQAEMGLTHLALAYLHSAYECFDSANSEKILRQVIGWILHLVNGDSVNVKSNRAEIVEESLRYLTTWIQMAAKNKEFEPLDVFESSVFSSCSVAREWKPMNALNATYQCAAAYLQKKTPSSELISICRAHIESELCTPLDDSTFESCLDLVRRFSERCPEQMELILTQRPKSSWSSPKVLPVLCAIGGSDRFWNLLKDDFSQELSRSLSTEQATLDMYVKMMEFTQFTKKDTELFMKQFEALDDAILKTERVNENAPVALQSASAMLSVDRHEKFMERITERFKQSNEETISILENKYYLSYLQNKNTTQLMEMSRLNFNKTSQRQLVFAACNRDPMQEVPEKYSVAMTKANLLRNSPNSLKSLESFLKNIKPDEKLKVVDDFEYLCDFDSADTDPKRCQYETSSLLWRQRMFCQFVGIYSNVFFNEAAEKEVLIEMLPFLMRFAIGLDSSQLRKQFAALLPVVLYALRSNRGVSTNLTSTIPLFLDVSGPLSPDDIHLIVGYLGSAIKNNGDDLDAVESSLNSLATLSRKQETRVLISEVSSVLTVVNKLLGHKKRFLRVLAANVKNLWERKIG